MLPTFIPPIFVFRGSAVRPGVRGSLILASLGHFAHYLPIDYEFGTFNIRLSVVFLLLSVFLYGLSLLWMSPPLIAVGAVLNLTTGLYYQVQGWVAFPTDRHFAFLIDLFYSVIPLAVAGLLIYSWYHLRRLTPEEIDPRKRKLSERSD